MFVVLNRNPTSQLNDISAWGDDAILVDPWNRLVCYARDYKKLPKYYLSFPADGKWSVRATYNADDFHHITQATELDRNYAMTGNSEVQERVPRLMEEYELIALDAHVYPVTKNYLNDLLNLFSFNQESN